MDAHHCRGAAEKWKNEFTFNTKSLSPQTINGRPLSGLYQRGITVLQEIMSNALNAIG